LEEIDRHDNDRTSRVSYFGSAAQKTAIDFTLNAIELYYELTGVLDVGKKLG